jgi:putative YhbY family RNA-binding protein
MNALTSAERRALRARAHPLHPVIMIGEAGLTPAVLKEIDSALKSHELIKIRVPGADRTARGALIDEICAALDASPVQHIGKILVIFRPRPEPVEPKPVPRRGKKPGFHPKRSYQNP